MLLKCICPQNINGTQTKISPKRKCQPKHKCHKNVNVTKTQMSSKPKCHQNAIVPNTNVTQTQMSPERNCYQNASVPKCKCHQKAYITVQLTAHVSLTWLPVLGTLYKPMSMHKSTNTQNC